MHDVEARKVRVFLSQVIDDEDKTEPFTDDEIAIEMQTSGFSINRGNVKYFRQAMKIPGSPGRRKQPMLISKSLAADTRKMRRVISDCIAAEDKTLPMSDTELAAFLLGVGYSISPQNLTYHRKRLGLPGRKQRKEGYLHGDSPSA